MFMFWQEVARAGAYTPRGHRLRSVGNVADTKLNCAAKGATLLQLILLSADVSQGPCGVYAPARAMLLARAEKVVRIESFQAPIRRAMAFVGWD